MTGTVFQIDGKKQTIALILGVNGTEYFSHRSNFVDQRDMFVGSEVSFSVAEAKSGPRPNAIDVKPLHRQAA